MPDTVVRGDWRKCRDGAAVFVVRNGGGVAWMVSRQQRQVMGAIAAAGNTDRTGIRNALYGADRGPLTASERASLSRTMRRLQERGLVDADGLTDTGRTMLEHWESLGEW